MITLCEAIGVVRIIDRRVVAPGWDEWGMESLEF
jgi:hypothetical protein